jgi:ABC-type siderophore export system fused ATPase/permease subunit
MSIILIVCVVAAFYFLTEDLFLVAMIVMAMLYIQGDLQSGVAVFG